MEYEHLLINTIGLNSNFFNSSVDIVGNRILSVEISLITNIPLQNLSTLPLILLPTILLTASILRILFNNKIYLLILAAYILSIVYVPAYTSGEHEIGFLLFLSVILTFLIYYKRNIPIISVVIISIIVAIIINFISYKITFLMIIAILSLLCMKYIFNDKHNKSISGILLIVTLLIPVIIAFSLNQFFYNSFVPFLEGSSIYNLGFLKDILSLGINTSSGSFSPYLASYFDSNPLDVNVISIFRFILIMISFFICILMIFNKIIKRQQMTSNERIFLAFSIASLAVVFVYNILGLLETTYITFCGFIGFGLIYNNLKQYEKMIKLSIIFLFVICIIYTGIIIYYNDIEGHVDYNDDSYILPSVNWTTSYVSSYTTNLVSDRYTGDYFIYQVYKNNLSPVQSIPSFRNDDLMILLEPEYATNVSTNQNYYIINNRLDYFVIDRWYQFKSWRSMQNKIESNHLVNKIYTTKTIDIYNN
jgi:MFS family permease